MKNSIPELLKDLRSKRGMTQKQFAEIIGIPTQSYAKYESGILKPGYGNLSKLARALDFDIDDFINKKEEKMKMQSDVINILDLFRETNFPVEMKMFDKNTSEALVTFRKEMEIWLEDKDAEALEKLQDLEKENAILIEQNKMLQNEKDEFIKQLDEYSQLYNKTMNQIESLKETIVKQAEMMVEMRYGK